jgi:hypothetical protein
MYRDGVRSGAYTRYYDNGKTQETGEYLDRERVGIWRFFDSTGQESVCEFRYGKVFRITSNLGGVQKQIDFDDTGNATRILVNGVEAEDRLARLADEGRIDDPRIQVQIGKPTSLEFAQTPLKDAIDFLAGQHGIAMAVDPQHVDQDLPITDHLHTYSLSTGLTAMLAPHDLGCDYRYGCLWITSTEDAENWHDPTGVADIVPPADSQLAKSWSEPVALEIIDKPLVGVIDKHLVAFLGIATELSQITPLKEGDPQHLVTINSNGMPFKHVLGQLLYRTRCRAKLDGETLVILPPE